MTQVIEKKFKIEDSLNWYLKIETEKYLNEFYITVAMLNGSWSSNMHHFWTNKYVNYEFEIVTIHVDIKIAQFAAKSLLFDVNFANFLKGDIGQGIKVNGKQIVSIFTNFFWS